MNWKRVSKNQPCKICGKSDWCTISEDGAASGCMRVESQKRMKNGGWLHQLKDTLPRTVYHAPSPVVPKIDFYRMWRDWNSATMPEDTQLYAALLGVEAQALFDLGAVWAWPHNAWAFPMRNGAGDVCGIRLRADSGRKWAVVGSKQGVFAPMAWPDMPKEALITEGPTDTAAALSLGFLAVGRASCVGCEQIVMDACKRLGARRAIIVADHDKPGLAGAHKLAEYLKIPWKIIVPPVKDMREWVQKGASKALVECVINQQLWKGVN